MRRTPMTMKTLTCAAALVLLMPVPALAQDGGQFDFSGYVEPGFQVTNDPDSSKFNEYRDIVTGPYLYNFELETLDAEKGYFAEMEGSTLFRNDQNIGATFGKYGRWNFNMQWDETPHLLSNKAQTPYVYRGGGLYEVGGLTVQETTPLVQSLAPATADMIAPGTGNDSLTAAWLTDNLMSTKLENERGKATATLEYSLIKDFDFRVGYSQENRDGN